MTTLDAALCFGLELIDGPIDGARSHSELPGPLCSWVALGLRGVGEGLHPVSHFL